MTSASSPIRRPDLGSPQVMTKRAWWLVVLNFVLPGSVQVLAGSRRLGRFGLRMTFTLITLAVIAGVVYVLWPTVVLTVFTNSIGLWAAALLLAVYAVVWLVLTLDTLRLVRLVRAVPRSRPVIAALTTVLMVAVVGTAGYGAYLATTASGFLSSVFMAGPTEPPVDGRYNILLLGGDAGPDRDGLRPDSISVVSIDAETGQASMIGLPRNLEDVPFSPGPLADLYPEGYGAIDGCEVDACMLNSIFTEVELKSPEMYPKAVDQGSEPGIEGMRDAAQGVTGLTIQYYVLIDMQGFSDLVDALGGVDITVDHRVPVHSDDTFTKVAFWFEPGRQHMDGYHALWYARSRHDTSDYDRMVRQRQVQEAILAQANPANVLSKFQAVASAGSQVVKTDIPQGMLGYFTNLASKTKKLPIKSVELVPDNNVDPENPDYDVIRSLIQEALAPPATDAPAQ
ncbi:LytR family transcriptional regulator [Cryobacterium sp. TMT1-21]|uniref:LytR family transcriptional regulator n=1 Tax=Cryobacterium shii TaxID=1259235 RepID=A0AAQ2C5S1_9MICO|nr:MULTISPECIES: LCP family protein [Cryobacterium]TFC44965.1 LytR family transcriptional regulator [Cryobacterium shii]TFD16888.1 LytR family transcriptional regulator [Cryobacterium sp. TMT1-21]TFD22856.1 LytR family transcriptional regulator [Cryobacterium sp. TMT2-23]TFD44218.1 LytR family transcriptional regulator [Cryobacterium sp. TMT2-10]